MQICIFQFFASRLSLSIVPLQHWCCIRNPRSQLFPPKSDLATVFLADGGPLIRPDHQFYLASYLFQVVELLLRRFPFLISVLTVERWSALHAACINGHSDAFGLVLRFPFAAEHRKTQTDNSGKSRTCALQGVPSHHS